MFFLICAKVVELFQLFWNTKRLSLMEIFLMGGHIDDELHPYAKLLNTGILANQNLVPMPARLSEMKSSDGCFTHYPNTEN